MNQASKSTYQSDFIIQSFFYLPMMLAYLLGFVVSGGFILAAALQFLVGIIQVLSGGIHAARYKEKVYGRYLMLAIGYLVFLFLGGAVVSSINFRGMEVLIIFFLFVIPVGIATWYYRLTWLGYKNAEVVVEEKPQRKSFQEDVLDDVML